MAIPSMLVLQAAKGYNVELLLAEALWWVDAADQTTPEQRVIPNRGTGGSALNAVARDDYLVIGGGDGTTHHMISRFGCPEFDLQGEGFEAVVKIAADNWYLGHLHIMGTAYWGLEISNGRPRVIWKDGDNNSRTISCTDIFNLTNGQTYWWKYTLTYDNGAGQAEASFYYAEDQENEPNSWTLYETKTGSFGPSSMYLNNGHGLSLGFSYTAIPNSGYWDGKFYQAYVRVDDNEVLTFNAAEVWSNPWTTPGQQNFDMPDWLNWPLWLPGGDQGGYIALVGAQDAGYNYVRVPHEPAFDLTDNIEVVARGALNTLTGPIGHMLSIRDDGRLQVSWVSDDYPNESLFTSARAPFTPGIVYWFKATLSVANNPRSASFYYAEDQSEEPESWTLIETVTYPQDSNVVPQNYNIYIGGSNANYGSGWGRWYRFILRPIGGGAVLDVDCSVASEDSTTFTALTGQTVTIGRSQHGKKVTVVPVDAPSRWLSSGSDTIKALMPSAFDFGSDESFTIGIIARCWETAGGDPAFIRHGGMQNGSPGYAIGYGGQFGFRAQSGQDVAWPQRSLPSPGKLSVFAGIVDREEQVVKFQINSGVTSSTSIASFGGFSSSQELIIGGGQSDVFSQDMEVFAAFVIPKALTQNEVQAIGRHYGADIPVPWNGQAIDITTIVPEPFLWFDFNDSSKLNGSSQYPSFASSDFNTSLTNAYMDDETTSVVGGRNVVSSPGGYLRVYVFPDEWVGSPGELVMHGRIEELPADTGVGLMCADGVDYPAVVTVNIDGVHYYAVVAAYVYNGGVIRQTTIVADTEEHVWSLRVDGANTQLYVDGVLAPWADGATDTSGNPYDWETGMTPGINQTLGDPYSDPSMYIFNEGGWSDYFPAYTPPQETMSNMIGWCAQFGTVPVMSDQDRLTLVNLLML